MPLADGRTTAISYIATVTGAGLFALVLAQQDVLGRELDVLTQSLGPSLTDAVYRQRLADAEAVVAVLDGLRETDPTATAMGLVKAHEALVEAVKDPDRNFATLVTAVGDFANQTSALQSALSSTPGAKTTTAK